MRIGDHPDCFDLDALKRDIQQLCLEKFLAKPRRYDYSLGHTVYDLPEVHVSSDSLILVDGIFALHKSVADQMQIRLFLTASRDILQQRYLSRHQNRETATDEDIMETFEHLVIPSYKEFIEPTGENATAIIKCKRSASGEPNMILERRGGCSFGKDEARSMAMRCPARRNWDECLQDLSRAQLRQPH